MVSNDFNFEEHHFLDPIKSSPTPVMSSFLVLPAPSMFFVIFPAPPTLAPALSNFDAFANGPATMASPLEPLSHAPHTSLNLDPCLVPCTQPDSPAFLSRSPSF